MWYIWIDLWDRKVWLALAIEGICIPKSIVPRTQIITELKKLQKAYEVTTFVVGLPYDLYGVKIKQLEKTEKFIKKLISIFPDIEVVWFDERFSTFEAKRVSPNVEVDDISASIILEWYLWRIGK